MALEIRRVNNARVYRDIVQRLKSVISSISNQKVKVDFGDVYILIIKYSL
jgi:hypothetical protein